MPSPEPRRERLVVVGNGMIGLRTIEELLERAPQRYEIVVFAAEPHPGYDRVQLSALLAGRKQQGEIVTHPYSWYRAHGIRLHAGDPVIAIAPAAKTVRSASGLTLGYDRLLLATGSKPIALPLPGLDLPGVCAFRDMADVETMLGAAGRERRAVVIGGGLLGLEAAWGLAQRQMAVTVVHLMPTLMERQLDATAASLLQRDLVRRGIAISTNAQTEHILGAERVCGVRLADGRTIAADLVVMAVGTRPNIELAQAAGLDINRGIAVGDDLRTSDPHIFAVGECVEHNGATFGLLAPLWEQARVCAACLAGDSRARYRPPPVFASLKITGVNVFSAGVIAPADDSDDLVTLSDAAGGTYKKLILRGDRLVGCVLFGDVADGPWYVDLIDARTSATPWRDHLIFGRRIAETAGHADRSSAALAA
jgi:nitrite reductase (NADH) large subunit